jgi:hypothetical protein
MDVEGRRASQLRVTASVGTVGVPDRIYGSHAYCSVYEFREQEVHGSCLSSYRMHYLALTQVTEVVHASLAQVSVWLRHAIGRKGGLGFYIFYIVVSIIIYIGHAQTTK